VQTYLVRRLSGSLLVLLGVTVIAFAAVAFIPADAVDALLGEHSTPEAEAAMRHRLGLDRPLWEQYLSWLGGLLRGDLGKSLNSEQPVTEMLRQRFPVTLELALLATIISVVVGVPAGLVAATRQYSLADKVSTGISMLGLSIPDFWLATLLILTLSVTWQLLPPGGLVPSLWEQPVANLKRLAMPAMAIGLPSAGVYFRMTRSAMLEVINSPYIVTAYSKGLRERQVIMVHALKNALIPVVTVGALEISWMLGGSFIIETIFSLPGLGRATVQAIYDRDFVVLQGCLLVFGAVVVGMSTGADLLYGWLDPRIRRD
jgi:peptide/nickel transport system permease protein